MSNVTSFGLQEAIRGLSQLRDALSAVETATARRRTPGRIAECEKVCDGISCRSAIQLRYAQEAGIPLNEIWNATSDMLYELLKTWETNDASRINLMQ
jgi:hypothetical protein